MSRERFARIRSFFVALSLRTIARSERWAFGSSARVPTASAPPSNSERDGGQTPRERGCGARTTSPVNAATFAPRVGGHNLWIAFIHPRAANGVLTELVQEPA